MNKDFFRITIKSEIKDHLNLIRKNSVDYCILKVNI